MKQLNMTRRDVQHLTAPFLALARAGYPAITAQTKVIIHVAQPVAHKYQWVQVAPGLLAQVTSDNGKELTIAAGVLLSWLGIAAL